MSGISTDDPRHDGGPAFPTHAVLNDEVGKPWLDAIHYGMDLRDWFAGQALGGIIRAASQQRDDSTIYWVDVAERAYGLADAMIAERSK